MVCTGAGSVMRLDGAIRRWALESPEKDAIVGSDERLTYAQLSRRIDSARSGLLKAGVRPGSRVMVILPNSVSFAVLYCALVSCSASFLLCDEKVREPRFRELIVAGRPEYVLSHRDDIARICEETGVSFLRPDRILAEGEGEPIDDGATPYVDGGSLYAIMFSSGSTGKPKGVQVTYGGMKFAVDSYSRLLGCGSDDRCFSTLPFSHMFGLNMGLNLPLYNGGTCFICARFSAEDTLDVIERDGVSVFFGVPTMLTRIIDEQGRNPRDTASLKAILCGGARVSNALISDAGQALGADIVVAYGSTEACAVSGTRRIRPGEESVLGVGVALPGMEVCVRERGELRPRGEGELLCKGPSVAKGLIDWEGNDVTLPMVDGWLSTGDVAHIDENGTIRILGRADSMIIRGGYNIFLNEVEGCYEQSPDVFEVCAVGVPDEEWGEKIGLAASLMQGSTASVCDLLKWGREHLPKNQVPDLLVVVDEVPHLPNGKIDRKGTASLFEAQG